ncbi:MAG: right-handed parallel beta-helix repeat-containing protein, partial [Eggerthellaceae bacterium]|nr:right-handed parallel beta-helix repeat-containing protein [Eggerthellaceae bacterium]
MNQRIQSKTSVLLFFVFVFCMTLFLPTYAEAAPTDSAPDGYVSVYDFGSDSDAAGMINNALQSARYDNPDDIIKIYIPSGEYHLYDILRIFSNTDLLLDEGAVLIMEQPTNPNLKNLLESRHEDGGYVCDLGQDCQHGGYSQIQNVTISGGTWTTGANAASWNVGGAIMLRHGENINLSNMTISGFANHYINVAGTKDVTITNVTCKDALRYTGSDPDYWGEKTGDERLKTIEEIQFDCITADAESTAYPIDGTTCQNATVSNCTFENVFAGVGMHHASGDPDIRCSNMVVTDCTFDTLVGGCIRFDSTDKVTIVDNTATTAEFLIYLNQDGGDILVQRNEIEKAVTGAIQIKYCPDADTALLSNTVGSDSNGIHLLQSPATLVDNTITSGTNGVWCEGAAATIEESDISNCNTGIVLKQSTQSIISSNVVAATGSHGIRIFDGSSATVNNNTINSKGNGIHVAAETSAASQNPSVATLTKNTINCEQHGIRVENKSQITASENNILSAAGHGFSVVAAGTQAIIDGNYVTGCAGHGMSVELGASATISNNTIESITGHGVNINGSGTQATVEDNFIKDCSGQGVRIESATATVKHNNVTNIAQCGVWSQTPGVLTILNNSFSNCGENGVYVKSSANKVDIQSNTMENTNRGINVDSCTGTVTIGGTSESLGNTIKETNQAGILVTSTPGIKIISNKVTNARKASSGDGAAIRVGKSKNATIKSNVVTGSNAAGILVAGENSAKLTGVVIDSNKVDESVDHGIKIQYCTAAKITNNRSVSHIDISNKFEYFIDTGCSNATVTGNTYGPRKTYPNGSQKQIQVADGSSATQSNNKYADDAVPVTTDIPIDIPTGKTLTYTGSSQTGVAKGTGYTITGNTGTNAGSYTATATLAQGYIWKDYSRVQKKISWKINPLSLAKATVTGIANKTYTGNAITQSPVVKVDGKTLKSGTDYTVAYKNNTNVGTATVTITGKGNYTGTINKTFKINKAKVTWKRLAGSNALATMEQITKEYGKATTAIVATNASFKDTLAASALAGGFEAPLLTTSSASLSAQTSSELKRIGVKTVYLMGTTSDVSAKCESQIKALGITVKRISNKTPSERAVAAAKQ